MIELSFTDVLFIVWGGIATGLACHFYAKERGHNMFVRSLIHNKELRDDFFVKMDEHIAEEERRA